MRIWQTRLTKNLAKNLAKNWAKNLVKTLSVLALTVALCSLPRLEARADDTADAVQSVIEVGVDLVLVRPLSVLQLMAGAALYGPAVAISFMDGQSSLDEAREIFISIPYEYVFERGLGDF